MYTPPGRLPGSATSAKTLFIPSALTAPARGWLIKFPVKEMAQFGKKAQTMAKHTTASKLLQGKTNQAGQAIKVAPTDSELMDEEYIEIILDEDDASLRVAKINMLSADSVSEDEMKYIDEWLSIHQSYLKDTVIASLELVCESPIKTEIAHIVDWFYRW